jgi:hypothetical protein
MEMNLQSPTNDQRDTYQNVEVRLEYIMKAGTQPIDFTQDEWGTLTVLVYADGSLWFEYFQQEPNNDYFQPPDDQVTLYHKDCGNVEAAKRIADIVLFDIEHTTVQRWSDSGFEREII